MAKTPRMTLQTQLVLRTLLESPAKARYGLELSQAAGLPTGTIHPILARLENAGWLGSFWEEGEIEKTDPPRPRRRYYRFTQHGAESARLALASAYQGGAASARLRPATDGMGS